MLVFVLVVFPIMPVPVGVRVTIIAMAESMRQGHVHAAGATESGGEGETEKGHEPRTHHWMSLVSRLGGVKIGLATRRERLASLSPVLVVPVKLGTLGESVCRAVA